MENFVIFPWVADVYPAAQDCVGGLSTLDGASVGIAVHAGCHAADDVDSGVGEFPGVEACRFLPVLRAGSRAHDGHRRDLVFRETAFYKEGCRAVFIWKKPGRIVRVAFRDDADVLLCQAGKLLPPYGFIFSRLKEYLRASLCEDS